MNIFLAGFFLEDVAVAMYQGLIPNIVSRDLLIAATGESWLSSIRAWLSCKHTEVAGVPQKWLLCNSNSCHPLLVCQEALAGGCGMCQHLLPGTVISLLIVAINTALCAWCLYACSCMCHCNGRDGSFGNRQNNLLHAQCAYTEPCISSCCQQSCRTRQLPSDVLLSVCLCHPALAEGCQLVRLDKTVCYYHQLHMF